jgi:hypothetical protein
MLCMSALPEAGRAYIVRPRRGRGHAPSEARSIARPSPSRSGPQIVLGAPPAVGGGLAFRLRRKAHGKYWYVVPVG